MANTPVMTAVTHASKRQILPILVNSGSVFTFACTAYREHIRIIMIILRLGL